MLLDDLQHPPLFLFLRPSDFPCSISYFHWPLLSAFLFLFLTCTACKCSLVFFKHIFFGSHLTHSLMFFFGQTVGNSWKKLIFWRRRMPRNGHSLLECYFRKNVVLIFKDIKTGVKWMKSCRRHLTITSFNKISKSFWSVGTILKNQSLFDYFLPLVFT